MFPGIERLSGIPTMVVIDADGQKREHLDCDSGQEGIGLLTRKGVGVLDDWSKHAWPA